MRGIVPVRSNGTCVTMNNFRIIKQGNLRYHSLSGSKIKTRYLEFREGNNQKDTGNHLKCYYIIIYKSETVKTVKRSASISQDEFVGIEISTVNRTSPGFLRPRQRQEELLTIILANHKDPITLSTIQDRDRNTPPLESSNSGLWQLCRHRELQEWEKLIGQNLGMLHRWVVTPCNPGGQRQDTKVALFLTMRNISVVRLSHHQASPKVQYLWPLRQLAQCYTEPGRQDKLVLRIDRSRGSQIETYKFHSHDAVKIAQTISSHTAESKQSSSPEPASSDVTRYYPLSPSKGKSPEPSMAGLKQGNAVFYVESSSDVSEPSHRLPTPCPVCTPSPITPPSSIFSSPEPKLKLSCSEPSTLLRTSPIPMNRSPLTPQKVLITQPIPPVPPRSPCMQPSTPVSNDNDNSTLRTLRSGLRRSIEDLPPAPPTPLCSYPWKSVASLASESSSSSLCLPYKLSGSLSHLSTGSWSDISETDAAESNLYDINELIKDQEVLKDTGEYPVIDEIKDIFRRNRFQESLKHIMKCSQYNRSISQEQPRRPIPLPRKIDKFKKRLSRSLETLYIPQSEEQSGEDDVHYFSYRHVAFTLQRVLKCKPPHPDTLKLKQKQRVELCFGLYERYGANTFDWKMLAGEIGLTVESIDTIESFIRTNGRDTPAEIVLRHWQFCFNRYGVDEVKCPRPCSLEELKKMLTDRQDLLNILDR